MISEKEFAFLRYWESVREGESGISSKIMRGLPMALLFSAPIILFILVVKIFLPEWYMKISQTSPGMFLTAVIAMLLVVLFYAFFRMQYKWEMNEQLYKELKSKEHKEQSPSHKLI